MSNNLNTPIDTDGNAITDATELGDIDMSSANMGDMRAYFVEYIESPETTSTTAYTGVSKDTALRDGKFILYRNQTQASGNWTLNLTLSDGTTTGAKPVYSSGTTNVGTMYKANSVIPMVYRTSANAWYASAGLTAADLSGKVDKANPAVAGNLASLVAGGGIQDSGKKAGDFATAAEAEALRNGKLDNGSAVWNVSYTDDGLHIADTAGVYYIDVAPGRVKTNYPNVHNIYWPENGGTLALLSNFTGNFSSSTAYAKDALVVYMGVLYRCVNPNGHTGAWVAADFTVATVEDILAALRTGKADTSALAPLWVASETYDAGNARSYNGKVYECILAVNPASATTPDNDTTHWKVTDMTSPDATLDITADARLRVMSAEGQELWSQGYALAGESSVTLSCDKVNYYAFASGTVSQAFTMPTAAAGKVGDFVLDVDNSANASADATATLTGWNTAFDVYTTEGEVLSDLLTFAGGEKCELYFSLTAFGTAAKPAWKISKVVVEKQEAGE